MVDRDYEHWLVLSWPYSFSSPLTNKYFNHITVKTTRPWFRGMETSRRYINIITRLRISHICTGEHFARMGWNLPKSCPCGNEFKSLTHLFKCCPLLSTQRMDLRAFLLRRFPQFDFDDFSIDRLIFAPDLEITNELGKFFSGANMII